MATADGSYWAEVQDLFDAALTLEGDARAALLDARCAGDTGLRREVESLLAAHARASGGFIAPATLEPTATTVAQLGPEVAPAGRLPFEPRTVGHYRLIERLGAGGMGEVFRARDLALGRDAALKLLPPQFESTLRERLLAEAEASARLQHPAIATFYEAGEAGGVAFIAMELVHGPTLRQLLARGPLPVEEALAITRCVLEALEHAHASGLLHRDIKPENLIVVGPGSAKLLDFGIAKALYAEPDAVAMDGVVSGTATRGSHLAGTIGYLAPEQVLGDRLDARTDVFQAAVVAYEMLTGRDAAAGTSPLERLASAATWEPDLEALRTRGVPDALTVVLARALARDRSSRYPGAAAFLRDLQDVTEGRVATSLPRVLAVCELQNLTGNEEADWVASAISESLRGDLAVLAGITVLPREKIVAGAQTLRQRGAGTNAQALGLHLACRWAIEGELHGTGASVRATVRLLDISTAEVVAAQEATVAAEDLLPGQARLASAMAAALTGAGQPLRHRQTAVEAQECYARARLLIDRIGKGSLDEARVLLQRTIAIEPGHVPALAALASAYVLRSIATTRPADVEQAVAFADRALAVDPRHAPALVWKGYALTRLDRFEEAEAALRRAAELDPTDAVAPYFAGVATLFGGRREESLSLYQRSVELDAFGMGWLGLGAVHTCLEHDHEALYCFRRALKLEETPGRFGTAGAAAYVGAMLAREGRLEEARTEALAGIESAEKSDHAYRDTFRAHGLTVLGTIALHAGDTAAAAVAFQQVLAQAHGRPRVRACGHFVVRALAGLARATGQGAPLDEACRLFDAREIYNFEPFYGAFDDETLFDLALAARAVGRSEQAEELAGRARVAGSLRSLPPSPS